MISPSMREPVDRETCGVEIFEKDGEVALCVSSRMETTTVFLAPEDATQIARAIMQQAIITQSKNTTGAS